MRLPQEIIDVVIDHLHDDSVSLRNCSVVCKAFYGPSITHIFRTATLRSHTMDEDTGPYLCHAFERLIERSPHIAFHVREIQILQGSMLRSRDRRYKAWAILDGTGTLPRIFRQLPRLTSLTLRSFGTGVSWTNMHSSLQISLCNTLAAPSLHTLELRGIHDVPATVFRWFQGLKNLTLISCMFDASLEMVATTSLSSMPSPPQLETLTLSLSRRVTASFVDWLLDADAAMDITTLRRIAITNGTDMNVWGLLGKCTRYLCSLEFLIVEAVSLSIMLPIVPEMDYFASLKSLHMVVPLIEYYSAQPNPFPWVLHLLDVLCPNNTLETITIVFNVDHVFDLLYCDKRDCERLDNALSRSDMKSLHKVEIVAMSIGRLETFGESRQVATRILPLTAAKGILNISMLSKPPSVSSAE